jgi:hypothetical protein
MRFAPALALSIAAVLSLGACQQQHDPIVPSAAPSATPVFASDEEALAAAEEAYRAFQSVSDQILADGGEHPERLETVATPSWYEKEIEGYAEARDQGWHLIGSTGIDSVSLQSYVPDSDGGAEVTVYACIDLSGTDVVNDQGDSVVAADRQTRLPFQTTFEYSVQNSGLVLSEKAPWSGEDFCVVR